MKKTWVAVVLLIAIGCQAGAEENGKSTWAFRAEVEMDDAKAGGLAEAVLPPEIIAKAAESLSDLRLVCEDGSYLPYVVQEQPGSRKVSLAREPKAMLNRGFLPGKQASVVVDFGDNQQRNLFEVVTPGENFRRRAMVEGGNDGVEWQVLADNLWLFAIPKPRDWRRSELNLEASNYRFYRITVFNGAGDPDKLDIASVKTALIEKVPADQADVAPVSVKTAENTGGKCTEIEFDLGYENLHLRSVEPDFAEQNFLRAYELFGRNSKTHVMKRGMEGGGYERKEMETPWTQVASGALHRFAAGGSASQMTSISCDGRFRYLLLRIHNQDDKPLSFSSAKISRMVQRLLFKNEGKRGLALLLGNPDAARPNYDLSSYVDKLRGEGVAVARLGQVGPNPLMAEREKPWSERNQWLLTPVIILLAGIMGVLVWKQARQAAAMGKPD